MILRLVVLAILIYIGYLLIRGGFGKKNNVARRGDSPHRGGNDVLVEDPVCKKLVPKQQAVTLEHGGETIYFCSEKCCRNFVSEKGEDR